MAVGSDFKVKCEDLCCKVFVQSLSCILVVQYNLTIYIVCQFIVHGSTLTVISQQCQFNNNFIVVFVMIRHCDWIVI